MDKGSSYHGDYNNSIGRLFRQKQAQEKKIHVPEVNLLY